MGEADVVKANSSSQDAQSSTSAISDSQVVSVLSFSSISNVVGPLPLSSSRGRSLLQLSAGWDPSMCAQTHTAPPDLVPTISTTEAAHTTQGGFIGKILHFPLFLLFLHPILISPGYCKLLLALLNSNRHFLPTPKYSQELYLLFASLQHPLVHLA